MDRYYQPQNSKDAMRQIEKLFNKYKDAPLTKELFDYHQKLLEQMINQILPAAKQEQIAERVDNAQTMIKTMQHWSQLRLNHQEFNGRMHHFQFEAEGSRPQFKRNHIKNNQGNQPRSTRH